MTKTNSTLIRGAAIVRLRNAQCQAARGEVLAAEAALAAARAAEERRLAERTDAELAWDRLRAARRPDPALIRLAGGWLVQREADLMAAMLDTAIAQGTCDAAVERLGETRACWDASSALQRRLCREAARRHEAEALAAAADAFLWRRS